MAVATGVAAAGFMVAGCSQAGSSSPASGPVSPSASAASAASAPPAASVAVTGTAGTSGAGALPPSSPAAYSPGQAAGGAGKCQPGDLSLALGAKTGTTQVVLAVDLTNKGTAPCTMHGYPGVDLVGSTSSQHSYRWSLARQPVAYSAVTLQPGQVAHFNLTYLPAALGSGGNISVAKIVITPPNDLTQAELAFAESIVLQDGATHPGTYIGPVVAGA
jgi:hypothetical protein